MYMGSLQWIVSLKSMKKVFKMIINGTRQMNIVLIEQEIISFRDMLVSAQPSAFRNELILITGSMIEKMHIPEFGKIPDKISK